VVLMFSYMCPGCGASAYSSSNAVIVGACPNCSQPLEFHAEPSAQPQFAHSGHASAVARLGIARDEEGRLAELLTAAVDDRARRVAEVRLSAAHADVAAREEWLSWVDLGESLEPWADGDWAPGMRAAPLDPPPLRA
jgi:hypothetical protein